MTQTRKRNRKSFSIPFSDLKERPQRLVKGDDCRAMTLDLDRLRWQLMHLAGLIEPIKIPSKEAWEGMLLELSLGLPFKNEDLYWAYHAYFGSERFRAAVDEFNGAVTDSGLVELAQGKAPDENSAASQVLRTIDDKRSALLDSWFHFGEGFLAPAFATVGRAPGPAPESLPRRKARGGRGRFGGARLWGFEDRGRLASGAPAAGGARCFRRKRRRRTASMAAMRGSDALALVGRGLATSRGHEGRVPARGGRRRRRSTVRGGMRGDGHELSILIRLGDGERQGRGPSNVSTMIIRPPQQGQRRAGETSSARPSASREGWGAFSAAAISWRARSML